MKSKVGGLRVMKPRGDPHMLTPHPQESSDQTCSKGKTSSWGKYLSGLATKKTHTQKCTHATEMQNVLWSRLSFSSSDPSKLLISDQELKSFVKCPVWESSEIYWHFAQKKKCTWVFVSNFMCGFRDFTDSLKSSMNSGEGPLFMVIIRIVRATNFKRLLSRQPAKDILHIFSLTPYKATTYNYCYPASLWRWGKWVCSRKTRSQAH